MRYLLEKGATLDSEATRGDKPLHSAAEYGTNLAIEELLKLGVDIETPNYPLNRPINLACIAGKVDTVKLLLDKGADIEVQGCLGVSSSCARSYNTGLGGYFVLNSYTVYPD